MSGWAEHVVRSFGLWGVATLMVLENLFPPIPSELILPLAATSGSLLGALFLYGLGASTLRTLNFLEPPQGEVRAAPLWADCPLVGFEVLGPLHAQLEREAGEGLFRGVGAEPRPLLFGDPESAFYPRLPLRRPREVVLGVRVGALGFHDPMLAQDL